MWGLIPAAGRGSRIQPLAFSKELLPVGSRTEDGVERPVEIATVGDPDGLDRGDRVEHLARPDR